MAAIISGNNVIADLRVDADVATSGVDLRHGAAERRVLAEHLLVRQLYELGRVVVDVEQLDDDVCDGRHARRALYTTAATVAAMHTSQVYRDVHEANVGTSSCVMYSYNLLVPRHMRRW